MKAHIHAVSVLLAALALMAGACGPRARPSVPYDLQFIDAMVVHHQAAIDMSLPADTSALHPELRDFARRVIEDQSREGKHFQSGHESCSY